MKQPDDRQYALLEHLSEGVVVCGPDSRVLAVNAAALRLFGKEPEDIVGKGAAEFEWGLAGDGGSLSPAEEHPVLKALRDGISVQNVPLWTGRSREGDSARGLLSVFPEVGPKGAVERVVATIVEVLDAPPKDGLFDNERGLAAVFLSSPVGIFAIRVTDECFVDANGAFLEMVGLTRAEVMGRRVDEIGVWGGNEGRSRILKELQRHGRINNVETPYGSEGGSSGVALTSMELVDFSGELCVLAFMIDITDRKAAEEALRESEARYRLVSENVSDVIWLLNFATWRFEYVSPSVERMMGYTVEEILQQTTDGFVAPEQFVEIFKESGPRLAALAAGDESARVAVHEVTQVRKDGTQLPTEVVTTLVTDEHGRVTHVQGITRDISTRKVAEDELRFRETMLRETGRIAKVGGFRFDAVTGEGYWTDEVAHIHDMDPDTPISRDIGIDFYVGDSREKMSAAVADAVENAVPYDLELEIESAKGVRKWVRTLGRPVVEDGRVVSVVGSLQDISDRRQAAQDLRESEERFRTLIEAAPDGVFVHSGDRLEFVNRALCRMLGARSADELIGRSLMDMVAPEYRGVVRERMETVQATGGAPPLEHEYVRPDGSRISVEATAVELGERGSGTHLVFLRDITDRKAAEADREDLRRQLQHSQKMESVGQLAGGVAHDFNNILMVQKGYCEMMRAGLRPGDPLAQDLAQIEACTERAAALTKQLLAFSRKQTLQPRLLDLNVVVSDLGDVLRRLLGEDMELVISPAPQPELVKADPGQLEQVLVNLAVNARDAMAGGGRLAIVVSHAWLDRPQGGPDKGFAPGTYVSVSLTDTGCGMDEETQSRAFEPFFTTKPEGKGTGLGLAMVHGIVHQSGGDIAMSSTLGQGTSFTLYLPACEERPAQREAAVESAVERGTAELILVVEDERALRRLAVTMLEKLGYRATAADSGEMALTLVEGEGVRPDLVLTDLVMPGIRGGLLVKRLRETLPDLKIVYMSGYADDSLGEEAGSTHFLHKPFSLAGLSAVVKAALDEPRLS